MSTLYHNNNNNNNNYNDNNNNNNNNNNNICICARHQSERVAGPLPAGLAQRPQRALRHQPQEVRGQSPVVLLYVIDACLLLLFIVVCLFAQPRPCTPSGAALLPSATTECHLPAKLHSARTVQTICIYVASLAPRPRQLQTVTSLDGARGVRPLRRRPHLRPSGLRWPSGEPLAIQSWGSRGLGAQRPWGPRAQEPRSPEAQGAQRPKGPGAPQGPRSPGTQQQAPA